MEKVSWRLVFFAIFCSFSVACEKDCGNLSPTSPSASEHSGTNNSQKNSVLNSWSPYVGVHVTGEAMDAYMDAFSLMKSKGTLRGLRVGVLKGDENRKQFVIAKLETLGLEMLFLVDNLILFDPNIEQRIDEIISTYANIRYLQIGNEITTILPKSGPTMSIEEYMLVFKKIYNHVIAKHPNIILVTQSTFGSGTYGSEELQKMSELGLEKLSPQKVIIGVNVYTKASLDGYTKTISGVLRSYRIWVTESGTTNPNEHPNYVASRYPVLRSKLRAERIYWYVMWGGEEPPDSGYGLIRNPKNYPNFGYDKTPLFNILAGLD